MAIKWKSKQKEMDNNGENLNMEKAKQEDKKTKLWLGFLLIFVALFSVSIISYKVSPVILQEKETAQKEWEKENNKEKTNLQINYLSDLEKMSLVSNIYYLDYKLSYLYGGLSAEEYLLKENQDYQKATASEKEIYENTAKEYMDVLYSVYRMDYGVGGTETYTYIEDAKEKSSVGHSELLGVLEGKDLDNYQSFLALAFDEQGNVTTQTYSVEEGNFTSYLKNIKPQAIADYFHNQDMAWSEIEDTEIYYEEENDETTYVEPYGEDENVSTEYEEITDETITEETYIATEGETITEETYIATEGAESLDEIQGNVETEEIIDTAKTEGVVKTRTKEIVKNDETIENARTEEVVENSEIIETATGEMKENSENEEHEKATEIATEEIKNNLEISAKAQKTKIKVDFPEIRNKNVVIGFKDNSVYYYEPLGESYDMSFLLVVFSSVILFVVAVVLQNVKVLGLKELNIFKIPTEVLIILGSVFIVMFFETELHLYFVTELKEDIHYWMERFQQPDTESLITGGIWIAFYGVIYFFIANTIPYILHPIKNTLEKSIILCILLWIGKKLKKFFCYLTTIDADKGVKDIALKIATLNLIACACLCCGWFVGIVGAMVYSIVIYLLLVKKGTKLQKQYDTILSMTKDMAEGNLNVTVEKELGVFEPVKQELSKVREGFSHAVKEEVRSQNMKTELITNVSHDLKTPLTAIITYVNLLKEEKLSQETRKEYVDTLDKKSQRLKVLIEDLFEVSKANSNNITLHYADMDIVNLVKQVRLENEEQIANSDLLFRWELPEEKCILRLDPQKTYRIIENLIVNALKYSMAGSRVYVQLENAENEIIFMIKNISAAELNVEPDKLTERFVRGDASRNTEGSGLGLAIVQSFTEVQGGRFDIEIDGDLFKAIVRFVK